MHRPDRRCALAPAVAITPRRARAAPSLHQVRGRGRGAPALPMAHRLQGGLTTQQRRPLRVAGHSCTDQPRLAGTDAGRREWRWRRWRGRQRCSRAAQEARLLLPRPVANGGVQRGRASGGCARAKGQGAVRRGAAPHTRRSYHAIRAVNLRHAQMLRSLRGCGCGCVGSTATPAPTSRAHLRAAEVAGGAMSLRWLGGASGAGAASPGHRGHLPAVGRASRAAAARLLQSVGTNASSCVARTKPTAWCLSRKKPRLLDFSSHPN